jgi:hypothetical protein
MHSAKRRFCPALEFLEDRVTPAGNVTTTLVGGSLTITGDNQANGITLSQSAAHSITITPDSSTSVNGMTAGHAVSINNVTGDVSVNLGQGDDSLTIDLSHGNLAISGNLTLRFGNGNSTVATTTAKTTNLLEVGGNLTNSFGNGTDSVTFNQFHVAGNLSITHADGNAFVNLGVDSANLGHLFSSVGGNLTVDNVSPSGAPASGFDINALEETNVGGNVDVDMGLGASNGFGGWTTFGTLTNHLVHVGGSLSMDNLTGSMSNGDFLKDGLEVVNTTVSGAETLNMGSGTGSAVVGDGFGAPASSAGSISISGTGTNDQALVFGTAIANSLSVSLTGGGTNKIGLDNLTVGRGTTVTTGAGADSVAIDNTAGPGSTFGGSVVIDTGAGNDTLSINSGTETGTIPATHFNGSVDADLGGGNDTLTLATKDKVSFAVRSFFDGGTGSNLATVNQANLLGKHPVLTNFA